MLCVSVLFTCRYGVVMCILCASPFHWSVRPCRCTCTWAARCAQARRIGRTPFLLQLCNMAHAAPKRNLQNDCYGAARRVCAKVSLCDRTRVSNDDLRTARLIIEFNFCLCLPCGHDLCGQPHARNDGGGDPHGVNVVLSLVYAVFGCAPVWRYAIIVNGFCRESDDEETWHARACTTQLSS